MTSGKGLYHPIDNDSLIIARFPTIYIVVVGFFDNFYLFASVVLVRAITLPKLLLGWERIHVKAFLFGSRKAVKLERLAITAERERSIKKRSIIDRLLDTRSFHLPFSLGFDDRKGLPIRTE